MPRPANEAAALEAPWPPRKGLDSGDPVAERLDSWKEIADYLDRDVRTVQRWEEERRLPVHRLPGGDRPRVYAVKTELDAWLRAGPPETASPPESVAVLPFVNLTADKESEYFGDGLADEVINALTRVPGLRVIARTSSFAFRSKELDVRQIGGQLGATALLEGSVRRQHGRVRVSAQLVSASDGCHLWSETYDREFSDIFAIQDDLARAIALALRVRLHPAPLVERMTDDLEAYGLWLRGRCLAVQYTPEAVAEARRCYEAAIARDPAFPLPYIAVAELLFDAAQYLVMRSDEARRGRQSVLEALRLNDRLGEAWALLGTLEGVLEYDWPTAERAFERAFALNPGSSQVLARHAWHFLVPKLRLAEAVAEFRQAVALDPLSPFLHTFLGLTLTNARDFTAAEAECRVAVGLAPNLFWTHWMLCTALIFQGRGEDAIAEARTAAALYQGPAMTAALGAVHGLLGHREEARRLLEQVIETASTTPIPPLGMAWAFMGAGDDRVFEWLDKAIEARDPAATHMPSIPIYDGIRDDPRFRALLAKMNLG